MYKAIIFDWDGTLFDSSTHIVRCVQQAFIDCGFDEPQDESIRHEIGLDLAQVCHAVMPYLSQDQMSQIRERFETHIMNDQLGSPRLFAGAEQVLHQLRHQGFRLGVATGKPRRGLNRDLTNLSMHQHFVTTRCADETSAKPHPQMLHEIMDELGLSTKELLMVGDTEFDMQLAQNAGVDAVGVSYGVHSRESLLKYNIRGCLSDISELPGMLINLVGSYSNKSRE